MTTRWREIARTWDIGDAELAEWARDILGICSTADVLRFMMQLEMGVLRGHISPWGEN